MTHPRDFASVYGVGPAARPFIHRDAPTPEEVTEAVAAFREAFSPLTDAIASALGKAGATAAGSAATAAGAAAAAGASSRTIVSTRSTWRNRAFTVTRPSRTTTAAARPRFGRCYTPGDTRSASTRTDSRRASICDTVNTTQTAPPRRRTIMARLSLAETAEGLTRPQVLALAALSASEFRSATSMGVSAAALLALVRLDLADVRERVFQSSNPRSRPSNAPITRTYRINGRGVLVLRLVADRLAVLRNSTDEPAAPAAPKPETVDVPGGYGHEGATYTLGINSGARGIGFGVSDQQDAIRSGRRQTTSLHMSMTPDLAEQTGRALIAHAAAVRARLASVETEEG